MQDKTSIGISDTFREFIEALVEEVVINGESFDAQKKWLRKNSEAEGLNYETLESNLSDLFDSIKELEEHESKSTERFAMNLAQSCYFSETEVKKLIENAVVVRAQREVEKKVQEEKEHNAKEEAERKAKEETERKAKEETERKAREERERRVKEEAERKAREERERRAREEKNRIPVKVILISLGVISLLDIIFLGWWCVIPLLFNAYFGMLVYDKCGQGEIGYEKLVFKGGALVVILFFASFLHWWSLLLILPAIYFIIGNDDNWDPK